jgi:hypothetical protein
MYTGDFVFKIRIGVKKQGIGKRGGYRLLYHIDHKRHVITPLALYFKPDALALSHAEIAHRLNKLSEIVNHARPPILD